MKTGRHVATQNPIFSPRTPSRLNGTSARFGASLTILGAYLRLRVLVSYRSEIIFPVVLKSPALRR